MIVVRGAHNADGLTREDRSARIFKAETTNGISGETTSPSHNIVSCWELGLEQTTSPFATAPTVYLPVM
jgi:hypothetical protein